MRDPTCHNPRVPKRDELVVFSIRSRDSRCSECGVAFGRGSFLFKQGDRGPCMECADLGHLYFLPRGDTALTRRATKHSSLRAVVVTWSTRRKRYERQGILVEPEAVERAEAECIADEAERVHQREIAAATYVASFAAAIRRALPGMPKGRDTAIAEHACMKYSGRVGRSAAAKAFEPEMIDLAVAAHVRHTETDYDACLGAGVDRDEARAAVRDHVRHILETWRRS
jgi:hypothetical protein